MIGIMVIMVIIALARMVMTGIVVVPTTCGRAWLQQRQPDPESSPHPQVAPIA